MIGNAAQHGGSMSLSFVVPRSLPVSMISP
jgi:hypothetical protein